MSQTLLQVPGWISPLTTSLIIISELLLAAVIGLGLWVMGAEGTAWILGGIFAGAIVLCLSRVWFQITLTPNLNARKIGQLLVGLTVGFSVQHSHLFALTPQIPLFILLTLGLLLAGLAIAWGYTRLEQTDLLTAILATTPGNIGVMASVAADYGRNPALVSLVQLMRFTVITSAIPLLTQTSRPTALQPTLHSLISPLILDPVYLLWLALILLFAGLSVPVGSQLKLPVPGLLGPLVIGMSFNAGFNALPFLPVVDFTLPPWLNVLGQVLLGITIGEYWGINPWLGYRTIVRAAVPAALTLFAGLAIASIAKLVTSWSWLTCLLVTAPGGSPEMIWIALTLDQNVEVVTAGHLVRLIAINLLLPVMLAFAKSVEPVMSTPTGEH